MTLKVEQNPKNLWHGMTREDTARHEHEVTRAWNVSYDRMTLFTKATFLPSSTDQKCTAHAQVNTDLTLCACMGTRLSYITNNIKIIIIFKQT